MVTIDRVSIHSTRNPTMSPYGYVVGEDGTCYSLVYQWYHGVVLALLYAEIASRCGMVVPEEREDIDIFKFQQLDTRWGHNFPALRVSIDGLVTKLNVSKGNAPATEAQIRCLNQLLKMHGLKWSDHVNYDDDSPDPMTISKMLASLHLQGNRTDPDPKDY